MSRNPETAALRTGGAALVLALALASTAHAEPVRGRARVLEASGGDASSVFLRFVRAHVGRALGNRIPEASQGDPLRASICVTLAVDGISVWDAPVTKLERGQFPRQSLASCPGPCSVALRDAAVRAVAEYAAFIETKGLEVAPRFLVMADAELPFETLLIALRSITASTAGAPPGLDLALRTPDGIRSATVHILPPEPLALRVAANPLLFDVTVGPRGWDLRGAQLYIPSPVKVTDVQGLTSFIGNLRSRDPNRLVVFVSAPPLTPLKQVGATIELVRREYPIVVLKQPGQVPLRLARPAP